jgi:hypothetical protein
MKVTDILTKYGGWDNKNKDLQGTQTNLEMVLKKHCKEKE